VQLDAWWEQGAAVRFPSLQHGFGCVGRQNVELLWAVGTVMNHRSFKAHGKATNRWSIKLEATEPIMCTSCTAEKLESGATWWYWKVTGWCLGHEKQQGAHVLQLGHVAPGAGQTSTEVVVADFP
jgi:hypothetical protein